MRDENRELSKDFTDLFGTRENAEKLLDLFAYASHQLNITNPDDPMIALTWYRKGSKRRLRLNYGNVLVFGIEGKNGKLSHILLLVDRQKWSELEAVLSARYSVMAGAAAGFGFVEATGIAATDALSELPSIMSQHLPSLVEMFSDWKRSPFGRYHNHAIMEAVLVSEKRDRLLEGGFEAVERPVVHSSIGRRAFDLLALLEESPYAATYSQRKEEYVSQLEDPFKMLFSNATETLPDSISETMELTRNVFSRIPKNDYGRGGAHSHYWGAIYPKEGKRISDAQLFLWVNHERVRIGFSIGSYAGRPHERHLQNATRYGQQLARMFESGLEDLGWVFGEGEDQEDYRWHAYFNDPGKFGATVSVELDKETFLQRSDEEIVATISDVWTQLYPLVLLSTSEDPIDLIKDYLLLREGEDVSALLEPYEKYTKADFSVDTGIGDSTVELWRAALERKRQVVLYGPPGTGKTYIAERLARLLVSEKTGLIGTVQFHPAYTYEEFMEGIRPERHSGGGLDYPTKNGRFVDFCQEADQLNAESPCVFIIDEINRANLARVFGELMYLLEYRNKLISLPSGQMFKIPQNVFVIGTMNTADRSIALVDHALRRRFAFLRLDPNFEVLRNYHAQRGLDVAGLVSVLEEVNRLIDDPDYSLGISFFMHEQLNQHLQLIWETEILPYLEEYFFDRREAIEPFRWYSIASRITPAG